MAEPSGKSVQGRKARYLSASQAATALGVSLPTLYSYVSRGMLRSERVVDDPRSRRYRREDVSALADRKELRRNPAKAAAQGLHWGSPVLESELTLISDGRLYYRGHDATDLALHSTIDEVAALLWTGDISRAGDLFSWQSTFPPKVTAALRQNSSLGSIARCQLVLPLAASANLSGYDLRRDNAARTGAYILRLLFSAVCGSPVNGSLDRGLFRSLIPSRLSAGPALRAALILSADHELNVSAFVARCIASARATLYEVILGALAALHGQRHGGAAETLEALFQEAAMTRRPSELLARHLRIYGRLPGFGHRLYPDGDPRARPLISLARMHGKRSAIELANGLIDSARKLTGEEPNLDFGLAMVSFSLALPAGSTVSLFALGRAIGWIAHGIEQYADNQLIRPRARYVGVVPVNLSKI